MVEAQKQVQVAKSSLEKVKAGAKQGEIGAKLAAVNRLLVELEGNIKTQQATIDRLEAELLGQQQSLQATGTSRGRQRSSYCAKNASAT